MISRHTRDTVPSLLGCVTYEKIAQIPLHSWLTGEEKAALRQLPTELMDAGDDDVRRLAGLIAVTRGFTERLLLAAPPKQRRALRTVLGDLQCAESDIAKLL
tara:strand:+ start:6232 stop:6537 length:306 start_codon:yes stop_codon:yes gene_type:complete